MTFAPDTTVQIRAKRYVLTNLSDEILADTSKNAPKGWGRYRTKPQELSRFAPYIQFFSLRKTFDSIC